MPTACIIEFQSQPDPLMFGRLLVAGGLCWLNFKPTDLPGDRFELCAIVVNLTGRSDCARHMTLGATEWKLTPRELSLETLDAAAVLEDIASGKVPRELLALIPLMKNGSDADIIRRWLVIADPEKDLDRRGDYALATVFAGLVDRRDRWTKALESFKMNESPVVREWRAEAERKGKADMLLLALQERFGTVPRDLEAAIKANTDSEQLNHWMRLAVSLSITTLEQLRQAAGV